MSLDLWDKLKQPAKWALKPIQAGRLKGKTDINPMWRYEVLTELLGPCGIGWRFEVVKTWSEDGIEGQKFVHQHINLYIKKDGAWSEPIPGFGGDMLIKKEKDGLYHNDEAYKMALTDALGSALKMIGMAADVYKGIPPETKYQKDDPAVTTKPADPGNYPVAMKNYSGPLSGMKRDQIEWIANEYKGKDSRLQAAAKEYLRQLDDAIIAADLDRNAS